MFSRFSSLPAQYDGTPRKSCIYCLAHVKIPFATAALALNGPFAPRNDTSRPTVQLVPSPHFTYGAPRGAISRPERYALRSLYAHHWRPNYLVQPFEVGMPFRIPHSSCSTQSSPIGTILCVSLDHTRHMSFATELQFPPAVTKLAYFVRSNWHAEAT